MTMSSTPRQERLVLDYLASVAAAAADLPPARRDELIADLSEHIAVARSQSAGTEAGVRQILDRLGHPDEIVAEARHDAIAADPGGAAIGADQRHALIEADQGHVLIGADPGSAAALRDTTGTEAHRREARRREGPYPPGPRPPQFHARPTPLHAGPTPPLHARPQPPPSFPAWPAPPTQFHAPPVPARPPGAGISPVNVVILVVLVASCMLVLFLGAVALTIA
jgi:hypothetical protein